MKARTINETIAFEKTKNPKKSLGVGGIDLSKEYERIKEKQKHEWQEYLNNLLVGKTITANMLRTDWEEKGNTQKQFLNGEFTIKVERVHAFENSDVIGFNDNSGRYSYTFTAEKEKIWINETMNFEKKKNPKETLDVGGVILSHEHKKFTEKINKEWHDFLEKLLVGKTISGTFNKRTKPQGSIASQLFPQGKFGWGEFTFKVKEINDNMELTDHNFLVWSEEDDMYQIPLKDSERKIHFIK